ncbi:phage major capsid protein [Clostridium sp. YIM B02569]|uniref:phage major capsid protein n=1 Tax=Clostridium sp. YIM B02569 TaxID=2911967 RepID=UPI001EEDA042|nr:phage major capsid protein [Clostridium sp. YIM B02569]
MIKVLETRALPPLMEKRNDLLEEMEALTDKAKEEKRALNVNEINRFNDIKGEIKSIDETLKIEEEQRKHIEWVPGKKKEGYTTDDKELRVFKEGEKIDIETRGKDVNLSIGKLVRAMSGIEKTGEGAQYLRDMSSATGSVVIPQKLANQILDKAREQSAIFGKIPVTVMENNNLTVARISKDASASFVAEGDLIPESSTEFIGVKLEGKTLAMYVPVTEQLLASANISDVLMNACSKAIAVALDKNLLYGTGTGAEIKGITAHENINKVSHTGNVDYNMLIKGVGATKGANIEPSDIVYNTTVGTDLSMLTDANGQYIVPPKVLDNYAISESNNIADNQALVYHRECMLLGVNKDIQMEWGYTQDGFQRMIKALRIYIRCDLGIVNEKGISLVTATT